MATSFNDTMANLESMFLFFEELEKIQRLLQYVSAR